MYVQKSTGMNLIEKRDYIHSHLHELDEQIIDELFKKVISVKAKIEVNENPISEAQLLATLEEAEDQIEKGDCISLEDLEKESESW